MKNNWIVQVVTKRPHGGIGAVLKNIEKYRDHSLFHFIYMFSEDKREKSFDDYLKNYDCTINILPSLNSFSGFCRYMKSLYNFYKTNKDKIKAVHVHTPNIALPHLIIAKHFGIKVRIVHSHNTCYSENKVKGLINFFLIYPIKFFITHKCACGKEAANFLFGTRAKNTYIFHNAIDTGSYTFDEQTRINKRQELKLENAIIYGHVGNFLKQKNHEYLIDVFSKIKKVQTNSKLLLIGIGQYMPEMQDKVHKLGLDDDVIFLGYRTDVKELLMAMDVFLFPSFFEGFPVALVEAQSMGLPCLVSNKITSEVGITDLVKFFPISQKNICEWVSYVLTLTSNDDRQKYSGYVKNAGYDLHQEVQSLDSYYSSIISI